MADIDIDMNVDPEDLDEIVEYLKERLDIGENVDVLTIDLKPYQSPSRPVPEVVKHNVH